MSIYNVTAAVFYGFKIFPEYEPHDTGLRVEYHPILSDPHVQALVCATQERRIAKIIQSSGAEEEGCSLFTGEGVHDALMTYGGITRPVETAGVYVAIEGTLLQAPGCYNNRVNDVLIPEGLIAGADWNARLERFCAKMKIPFGKPSWILTFRLGWM